MSSFAVGITGASGSVLARRLVGILLEADHEVHLCASRAGRMVIADELPRVEGEKGILPGVVHERLHEWSDKDFRAPFASGSSNVEGMVLVPCTAGTAGAIANGVSDNLLRRGADVMLKERRKLIVVVRETPLSEIHLANLLTLARAGAVVLPPMLTFYQGPGPQVSAQVDFIVSRILDQLGISNDLYKRWGD